MNAPVLTKSDRADMLARAIAIAPDLGCDDAVVMHLHRLGIEISEVSDIFDAALDEARANSPQRSALWTIF